MEIGMIDLKELDNDPWFTFPTKKDDLRALMAAVTWQPIETAPKDGTPFLSALGPFVYIVFWSDDSNLKSLIPWWEQGSAEWENNKWIGYHEEYYAASPTHWMPLPKPPKEGL